MAGAEKAILATVRLPPLSHERHHAPPAAAATTGSLDFHPERRKGPHAIIIGRLAAAPVGTPRRNILSPIQLPDAKEIAQARGAKPRRKAARAVTFDCLPQMAGDLEKSWASNTDEDARLRRTEELVGDEAWAAALAGVEPEEVEAKGDSGRADSLWSIGPTTTAECLPLDNLSDSGSDSDSDSSEANAGSGRAGSSWNILQVETFEHLPVDDLFDSGSDSDSDSSEASVTESMANLVQKGANVAVAPFGVSRSKGDTAPESAKPRGKAAKGVTFDCLPQMAGDLEAPRPKRWVSNTDEDASLRRTEEARKAKGGSGRADSSKTIGQTATAECLPLDDVSDSGSDSDSDSDSDSSEDVSAFTSEQSTANLVQKGANVAVAPVAPRVSDARPANKRRPFNAGSGVSRSKSEAAPESAKSDLPAADTGSSGPANKEAAGPSKSASALPPPSQPRPANRRRPANRSEIGARSGAD